jgi:hypothetical protein
MHSLLVEWGKAEMWPSGWQTGVGGWDDINIDSADFSQQLCDYMAYAAYLSEAAGSALGARSDIPCSETPQGMIERDFDTRLGKSCASQAQPRIEAG